MPIEFAGLNAPARPGETCFFTFQNPIIAYTLGFGSFKMTYGPTDAWVQSFIIKLLPNQVLTAGPNSYQVSANLQMTLQDADGHSIDVQDSVLWPVCIAVTGTPQPDTVMSVANSVASGSYQNVTLPHQRSGYSICTSFQSGVNLTFSSGGDHQVLEASAGCGLTYNENAGQVTATAGLHDGIGNNVQVATVDVGYIASTDTPSPLGYAVVSGQSFSPVSATIPQLTSISRAIILLQSWNVQFYSAHNVQTVAVGPWGPYQMNGNVVKLPNLSAQICDISGNSQDNNVSSVTALVLALP
jgi:hypothetical protein